ncbi:ACP phosphodiesterase [Vibrio sp. JC009]|uniref:acyl carrier protein phosphodiesterase n=1 Tax=Vibrio sp. JC009 TaxID=2912314 RepID=UPI0023AF4323|nr:ACP phosphodiesterase [Vibrio sp. JC009]WED24339.1 ACP phosphodiesterase [Vibrio sp. JC009]
MNFLAHLHIADTLDSDLAANLLGDFVKGDPYKSYPAYIADGIKLHRFVDSYTDSHQVMKTAKGFFPAEVRRFSPIALDLYWDHCLASGWAEFHQQSLADFCLQAEERVRSVNNIHLPEQYLRVTERMWKMKWLESYADFATLEIALERMSTRSPRMKKLAHCFETLEQSDDELSQLFPLLYTDVLKACREFVNR